MPRVRSRSARPEDVAEERASAEERAQVRHAVARFLVAGMATLLLVAIPISLWIRSLAENYALENTTAMTQRLADYALAPLVTDKLIARDPASIELIRARLEPWMEDGSIVRIKIWDARGAILYSDLPSLIGRQFALPEVGDLLADGVGTAQLEAQTAKENENENEHGELVEVYVRSNAASGAPLVFETYFVTARVHEDQNTLLLGVAPAFLVSLGVLQVAQLVPAVRLARRIQGHQATRRRLMQHAINASDLERRRIARDLHDNVIQDLAGLAYALEAEEVHGPPTQRPLLTRARSILQHNVQTLRGMTTELYPPDLDHLGLPAALIHLAEPLLEHGLQVETRVQESCELDRDRSAMFYRVAREALTNIEKHARATTVELSLVQDDAGTVMTIHDDGRGFDSVGDAPDGHLGLRIMRDTMQVDGGSLEVRSTPGRGTTVTATLARAVSNCPR